MSLSACDSHKKVPISEGLDYEEINYKAIRIHILRISPEKYRFDYHTTKHPITPSEWLEKTGGIAVINAGMFAEENYQHVGEVVVRGNKMPSISMKNYQGIFAFEPRTAGLPKAAVFDLNCTPFTYIKQNYRSYIQNMRFTSCLKGEQLWHRWKKTHSMSILGEDSSGRILFIFTPSDIAPKDFRSVLAKVGVKLRNSVYLEGGKEAGLAIKYGDFEFVGVSRGTPYPIPNVITVHPIEKQGDKP